MKILHITHITITHVMIECEVIKKFWIALDYYIQKKSKILIEPTAMDIIFGNFELIMYHYEHDFA